MPFNIMELIRRNRLSGLFNPLEDKFSGPNPNQYQLPDQYNQEMPQLNSGMQDQFSDLLSQFPRREKVGNWRKLGSVIAGLGSENPMQTADQFANYNYYNKLKDYTTKLPFFQRASENERSLNNQIMQQWMSDRKQDETERYNRERNRISDEQTARLITKDEMTAEINRKKLDIAERRASVYEFKARNPNFVFKTREDGTIIAINPQDPTKIVDTKVKSGELSDFDRISLQLDSALTQFEARGEITDRQIERRGDIQSGLVTQRGEVAKDVNESKVLTGIKFGTTAAGKPEGELEKQRRLYRRAQEAKNSNPNWSKYITIETGGRFSVRPPGSTFGVATGPTQEDYDKIIKAIYGPEKSSTTTTTGTDRIKVIGPNGETGTMLRSELSKFPGWKEVK